MQGRQQTSFGFVLQAVVERGIGAFLPTSQPSPSSRIEQSFSSLSMTIATSESGRKNAARWGELRSLHVDEARVEAELLRRLPAEGVDDLLDIGTGTGRILELVASRVRRAIGIDLSRDMLIAARASLHGAGIANCQVRQADMYRLPWSAPTFDAVTIHRVLHYAENPARVIAEAARVLRPGGRLIVVDFAPHALERLRTEHAHRRMGFAGEEVNKWCRAAGLRPERVRHLPGGPLTVSIWQAVRAPARPATAANGRRAAA